MMKKTFAFPALVFSSSVFAQEAAAKADTGNMYFLAIGLVIFLALLALYTLYEQIRDRREAKERREEEEARRLRIDKEERERELKQ